MSNITLYLNVFHWIRFLFIFHQFLWSLLLFYYYYSVLHITYYFLYYSCTYVLCYFVFKPFHTIRILFNISMCSFNDTLDIAVIYLCFIFQIP